VSREGIIRQSWGPHSLRHSFIISKNDTIEITEVRDQGSGSNKVSFYVTNIPECLPVFRLRQQFEVCGIMSDVFVARQCNSRGQVYGFVWFSNVKNADKLSRANNIWFGHLKVWAREVRYNRFVVNDNKSVVISRVKGRKEKVVVGKPKVSDFGEGEKIRGWEREQ
jgi:hypothetical protein